ncbi:replication/maintenance protein [Hydrococcus rivularis NIES-593]|uniref:Replication/maintenance protein n=1 Tax=Hydrococcus rivularis NIES-593 TaxID=1921803 RepID=A0A1U7HMJ2_9CYAN|nr:Crp/Fnr family transcriptional regulator [Hydrococcus rivularis]OKH24774.1 replication/maintenance protein [Hydrococcus rivularis NIES-593]
MPSSTPSPDPQEFRPFLTWQGIIDWAQSHYRERIFSKDERIPTRPGLLYLVRRGAVRIVGSMQAIQTENPPPSETIEKAFLGFVGAGQPFEIVVQSPFSLQAYAHVEETAVIWMYWQELDNWTHLRREVLEIFRYQHQRKQLWLCLLGQRRTIDRLVGFLKLSIEEYGEPSDRGYCLPYPLTHAQIGSAIGATRVTVTRLMGRLRRQGLISIEGENLICWPNKSAI